MNESFNKIISNALLVKKDNIHKKIKSIITSYKEAIMDNKDGLDSSANIDISHNNGSKLDFDIIDRIFKRYESEEVLYGKVTLSEKDNEVIYGKEILERGNVLLINDGNSYVILEMIIKNLLVCNTLILVNNGYNFGVNTVLIELLHAVLSKYNIDESLVQLFASDDNHKVLKNFANIDLVVVIGNHALQTEILNKSKNRTITSGYDNYDVYVEDLAHIDFINEISKLGLNIEFYVKDDLDVHFDNEIRVSDIDEAISQINYNSSRYATSIFTNNEDNASRFIREVKSSYVTVNTSPTIERLLDINTSDLGLEKTIIYPNNMKYDGTRIEAKKE